ncbi:hypothetical protein [Actinomadura sp. 7K534]|uniref:hypothetical protein n=1 Tax=Actinomadura sp. 7K534 TaxID=2530366 RepID=UPI001404B581|nr:hypothetical protein [Actinomadura sp. 7K534]
MLRENDDKVPGGMKTDVEPALAEVRKTLEGTDVDAIRSGAKKLAQTSQKMSAAIYAKERRTP